MRESIVCIGNIAKVPYRFPETGTGVSSYEELCYYISRHMICYLYTLPDRELLLFIKEELGLDRLYYTLDKFAYSERDLSKYFVALFREGNYFTEEELKDIFDDYRRLKGMSRMMQCKEMGDLFLKYHKASMAIRCYELGLQQELKDEHELGRVFHNLGLAKERLFRFKDAQIAFIKSYQYHGDEDSLYHYFSLIAMTEGMKKAQESIQSFQIPDMTMEDFRNRYVRSEEGFVDSDFSASLEKIRYIARNKNKQAAQKKAKAYIKRLQHDFRDELWMDEEMLKAKLPFIKKEND